MIDTKTQEIRAQDNDTYSDMLEIADELPDSSPRFVLLSYPFTLVWSRIPFTPFPANREDPPSLLRGPRSQSTNY